MDRLVILLIALAGMGGLWLAWRGLKSGLRRSIRVDGEVLNDGYPTLLYFHSDDCAPCRLQQSPILASLQQDFGDCVHFQDYDALAYPELARHYRVLTVPTTVVIAPGGEVVAINYGVARADKLRRQLEEAAAGSDDSLTPCLACRSGWPRHLILVSFRAGCTATDSSERPWPGIHNRAALQQSHRLPSERRSGRHIGGKAPAARL